MKTSCFSFSGAPIWDALAGAVESFNCLLIDSAWGDTQSYPILCNPRDCSPPGSSVHGISQARILEWVAISFFRGSSWPRDRTRVPWIGSRVLYRRATREALWTLWPCLIDHSVSRNEVDGQPTRILLSQCSEDILDLRSRNLITEHNREFQLLTCFQA